MMTTLEHVVRLPKNAVKNPSLLILLHGYGSNELDLFSFADELPEDLLIVSPRAPYELGQGSHAWYAIHLDEGSNKHSDLDQARESLDNLHQFIEEIKATYTTNPRKTFLLGFSQGAILSYAYSFLNAHKINYVIALSGYINEELLPENVSAQEITTEYYISHGSVDQVLPVEMGRKAIEILEKLNLKNSYSEYPVGHGVAPQNFYSFKNWIAERM